LRRRGERGLRIVVAALNRPLSLPAWTACQTVLYLTDLVGGAAIAAIAVSGTAKFSRDARTSAVRKIPSWIFQACLQITSR
jgi:hypothetical protein